RVSARVPREERVRLTRHLESLRELERQIAPTMATGAGCAPSAPPALEPIADANYPMVTRLQMDIMFMAFMCDQTRLSHLIWNGETSMQTFPWLDVNDPHHTMSHVSDSNAGTKAKLIKVNRWYAEQFAYFLGKMDGVKEADGKTMLDHSIVVWTNGLGKGNSHSRDNIPWVIAGSVGGYART